MVASTEKIQRLNHSHTMSNIYKFHFGDTRSTVVQCDDGSCLEIRRGDITWTRAFKAAHPEVQQCRWSSLESWWATLPVVMPPVEKWHTEGGWSGPSAAVEGATLYGLSTHLAYFMRCDYATDAQILEAMVNYTSFTLRKERPLLTSSKEDPVLAFFYPDDAALLYVSYLLESEHVYEIGDADAAARGYRLAWPSVTRFNLSGLRPVLNDEGPLEFGPAMTYFMGGWRRGSWTDIQRVYEAYATFKTGGVHPLVEEGSVVTDTFLRHVLQTNEKVMPWSTFRKLLLVRGLIWSVYPEMESLPDLIVEPVEVERPVARRLSFGSAPMEIDDMVEDRIDGDEAWMPAVTPPPHRPEEEEVVVVSFEEKMASFVDRVKEQADAIVKKRETSTEDSLFAELDALWDRVMEETEESECGDYHIVLMEEFIAVCHHEKYAAAWRSNAFKRIQMRASLRCWTMDHGENAVVRRFMDTVTGAM